MDLQERINSCQSFATGKCPNQRLMEKAYLIPQLLDPKELRACENLCTCGCSCNPELEPGLAMQPRSAIEGRNDTVTANNPSVPRPVFRLYLIKPSHYDDDGYVIQWLRSDIPSNTMAVLNGIALECNAARVLGETVDIVITTLDEANHRVKPNRIIREIGVSGGKGLVALIGVQSNQFPRAVDIARPLRAADVPVCIGGFHVSGSLAMLPRIPPEIQQAMDLGISVFAGEAEGQFDQVLRDAYRGHLKPIYNVMPDLPRLEGAALPVPPQDALKGRMTRRACFDSGRGCPFDCSFCTIINVQGRKSRYRTADDIEKVLRDHNALGIKKFFITDDNFARNKNWEAIFDRIIRLRQEDGMTFSFIIQVDTMCHKIPNFVTKAGLASVNRVFIGLESINPDNLRAARKGHNRITEYRAMLQAWKSIGVITCCGYIIGFPYDTHERVMRDIEIIKRELPVDLMEFFCLIPLPGSEDHKVLFENGSSMNPDMNSYDSEHVVTAHPLMSDEEVLRTYRQAWDAFYTLDHVETIMRRAAACGIKPGKVMKLALYFSAMRRIEGIHPLQGGLIRRKYRRDRRPGLPIESPMIFYPRYLWETITKSFRLFALLRCYKLILARVENTQAKYTPVDVALTLATKEDLHTLEIFKATEGVGHRLQQKPL